MLPLVLAGTLTLTGATVTSGTGWELGGGITHLDKTYWSIQFYDTYSRDRLTFYMKKTATELNRHTGVKFNVTTVINKNQNGCPGYTKYGGHRLIVRLDPNTATSNSTLCWNADGSAHSSRVLFSKNRWLNQTRGGSKKVYRRNVSSHELGHSVGLGHSPECDLPGVNPLMCGSKWGGYWWKDRAHEYTKYDIAGLKALVNNR